MAWKISQQVSLLCMAVVLVSGFQSNATNYMLGVNDFAIDLYRELASGNGGNLFYSPYSIYTAMVMTMVGARGNTLDEMKKALNWGDFMQSDEQNGGHMAFKNFNKLVMSKAQESQKLSFSLANKLWLQKYFMNNFARKYSSRLRRFHDADLGFVNFHGNTEEARKDINKWVAKKTNDKIDELIKPGILSPLTRLVLTNAIHFMGTWKTRFAENRTSPWRFFVEPNVSVLKPMMFVKSKFGYTDTGDFKVLELPYAGDKMSMLLFLPKRGKSLSEVEDLLSAGVVKHMISQLTVTEVTVRVPKFKLETSLELNKNLRKLGIRDLFDAGRADLSLMLGVKGLFISKVVHKAYIDVNEKGTEAAAATAVIANFRSLDPNRKFFMADRPFFFIIREKRSGAWIFVGKVTDP